VSGLDVAALLVLVAVLGLLLAGLWVLGTAWFDRRSIERRSELARVEFEASRLRYRLDARLRRTRLGLELADQISRAGALLSAFDLLAVYVGAVLFGFLAFNALMPVFVAPIGAWVGFVGVRAWLERKRRARLEEFVAQLPELARTLSNATSAGRSLLSALQMAAEDLADPAGTELRLVAEQLRIGASIDVALETLRDRLPSRELSVLVSTLVIQQRSGGDVVRALRDMADTLEARKDLRREVKTIVAGAVQTGYVTGAMGLGLVLLVDRSQGGMIDRMAREPAGVLALVVAGALYALAYVSARRMTDIDV
jgi:tight adherence protein B